MRSLILDLTRRRELLEVAFDALHNCIDPRADRFDFTLEFSIIKFGHVHILTTGKMARQGAPTPVAGAPLCAFLLVVRRLSGIAAMVIDVVVVVLVVAVLVRNAFFFSQRFFRSLGRILLQVLEPQHLGKIVEYRFQGVGTADDIRIFKSEFFGSLDNGFDIHDILGVVLPQGDVLIKDTDDDFLYRSFNCVDAVQFFLANPPAQACLAVGIGWGRSR